MAVHRCILVHPDGTPERVSCDQRCATTILGGALTFAGAVGPRVVVVARAAEKDECDAPDNILFRTHRHLFFDDADPPRGKVLFVGDVDGEAAHVDEDALHAAGLCVPHGERPDDAATSR